MPARFDWNAPHVMSVTVKGNTMAVAIDGSPMINIPDLTPPWRRRQVIRRHHPDRRATSRRVWLSSPVPTQVTLQQMTVTSTG